VRLATRASVDTVHAWSAGLDAPAVVLATGSTPHTTGWYAMRPELDMIPGADQPHVYDVWNALSGALDHARHVVVVDGRGYYQSSDVVEHLAGRGVRVSAVSSTGAFAEGLERNDRPAFVAAARRGGVTFHAWCTVQSIDASAVRLSDALTGTEHTIDEVDAVVLSLGSTPNDELARLLAGSGLAISAIGDCVTPRGVEHALFDGHRIARTL